MKIAVVTCYKQPDYIRALTLRRGLAAVPGTSVYIVKNTQTGLLRYPEVMLKVLILRAHVRPDAYMLTFRGPDLLPFMAVASWPKPFIYDELVNPFGWLLEPGREKKVLLPCIKLAKWAYVTLLKRAKFILADTDIHATYGSQLYGLPTEKFITLPVSTDESQFRVVKPVKHTGFRVFYYGNMLPLHGLQHVIDAALLLKNNPAIEFRLIGGKADVRSAITQAIAQGAHISYSPWVAFETLSSEIAHADLCLGGPFGKTTQANHVITGKTYQFLASGAAILIGQNDASQMFKNKVNCLSVPLGNSKAIAEAITWARQHPAELSQVAQKGHELYVSEFSEKVLATKLQDLLQHLS